MTVIIVTSIVLALLATGCTVAKRLGYATKLWDAVKAKMLWNFFLRSSMQSYIKIAYKVFFAITLFKWNGTGETAGQIGLIVTLTMLALLPIFYWLILHRN